MAALKSSSTSNGAKGLIIPLVNILVEQVGMYLGNLTTRATITHAVNRRAPQPSLYGRPFVTED